MHFLFFVENLLSSSYVVVVPTFLKQVYNVVWSPIESCFGTFYPKCNQQNCRNE